MGSTNIVPLDTRQLRSSAATLHRPTCGLQTHLDCSFSIDQCTRSLFKSGNTSFSLKITFDISRVSSQIELSHAVHSQVIENFNQENIHFSKSFVVLHELYTFRFVLKRFFNRHVGHFIIIKDLFAFYQVYHSIFRHKSSYTYL